MQTEKTPRAYLQGIRWGKQLSGLAGAGGGVEWSIAAGRDGSYKQENKWMMETGLRSEEGEGMRLE